IHGGKLPPLTTSYPDEIANVFVSILPFIEQEALYAHYTTAPFAFAIKVVPTFLSPLDPFPVQLDWSFLRPGEPITNYACNAYSFTRKPNINSYFTDGLSNTLSFSEHYQQCGEVRFYYSSGVGTPRNAGGWRASFADGGPNLEGGNNSDDYYPITSG